MELKIINSNSAGNCYILESESECLIIELGVAFMKIKQAIDFKMTKVVGAIVTHEHGDHAKSVADAIKSGIAVYATAGTHKATQSFGHHRAKVITSMQEFKAGGFTILPFDIRHDCAEPVGFMINHIETGNVLFLTDTIFSPYTFRNLHNIIIECNYSKDVIDENTANGKTHKFLRDRILNSHMNLETCKQSLQANDLTLVNNIVLIHLSDSNSDAARFHREVASLTGKQVTIAEPGLIIPFNKTPI